jgi:hypothetical protein
MGKKKVFKEFFKRSKNEAGYYKWKAIHAGWAFGGPHTSTFCQPHT